MFETVLKLAPLEEMFISSFVVTGSWLSEVDGVIDHILARICENGGRRQHCEILGQGDARRTLVRARAAQHPEGRPAPLCRISTPSFIKRFEIGSLLQLLNLARRAPKYLHRC